MDATLYEALRLAVVAAAPVALDHARYRMVAVVRGSAYAPESRVDLESGYAHVRGARLHELDAFEQEFGRHYPALPDAQLGAVAVGSSAFHPRDLVAAILRRLGDRDPSLVFDPDVFGECVQAFDAFVARPVVHVRTIAPLIGLEYRGADIPLAKSRLHALSDDERTDLLDENAVDGIDVLSVTCAIIVERDEDIAQSHDSGLPLHQDHPTVEQALRILRTFKSGTIWVRRLHQQVTGFWPGTPLAVGTILDRSSVTAPCTILAEEGSALGHHAERLVGEVEPSLELACSRLAEAETRVRPRDAVLDAAIGLEAILLHERSANHRYRGETRYRFSMHYAALAPPAERGAAFRLARDLYDARSAVAHGSTEDVFRMGDAKVPLAGVAESARSMLRHVVKTFLPTASKPAYVADGYWTDRLLGQTDQA